MAKATLDDFDNLLKDLENLSTAPASSSSKTNPPPQPESKLYLAFVVAVVEPLILIRERKKREPHESIQFQRLERL
jgi:hypothetical protein